LFPPHVKPLLVGDGDTPALDMQRPSTGGGGSESELLISMLVVDQEEGETIFV
jgi:hypothetical protein